MKKRKCYNNSRKFSSFSNSYAFQWMIKIQSKNKRGSYYAIFYVLGILTTSSWNSLKKRTKNTIHFSFLSCKMNFSIIANVKTNNFKYSHFNTFTLNTYLIARKSVRYISMSWKPRSWATDIIEHNIMICHPTLFTSTLRH